MSNFFGYLGESVCIVGLICLVSRIYCFRDSSRDGDDESEDEEEKLL